MKMEVTMLPDRSRATMPLALRPANDAGPRIAPASVRLRRLHARTWTGVSAELFEMHAADRRMHPCLFRDHGHACSSIPVASLRIASSQIGAGEASPMSAQAFCPRRQAPGLMPTILENTRVKWLWSAKPVAQATSASDGLASASIVRARSIRMLRCQ